MFLSCKDYRMRTIKIITFAAFLFIALPLTAQDTTKPFYFPHTTGDMWEYIYSEFGTSDVYTVQNSTIFDSTDSQGLIHITQFARRINPIQPPLILYDTTRYWIDTVNNYVYGRIREIGLDSLLVYKLNAQKGDRWFPGANIIVNVDDKWKDIIFGKETSFMRIRYRSMGDPNDSLSWLDINVDEIADGFGLVFKVYAEYTGEIHLVGAVINDTLYGKVTSAIAKEKENNLPLSIKLNQNYPNPFNPSTTISFEIYELMNISLIIYDVLGKEIYRLIDNKEFNTGKHRVVWNGLKENGGKAASGIYFYRLYTDSEVLCRSMILLK